MSDPLADQPERPDGLYTLAEVSRLTGLSVDALRQRIKRRRLVGIKGNDGMTRLRLTASDLSRLAESGQIHERSTSHLDGQGDTIRLLETEVASLRDALAREREGLARERERTDYERERADQERERAKRLGDELRVAETRAARIEGELSGLQVALNEARKPAWRRWLGLP
jgi:hypothetical protein